MVTSEKPAGTGTVSMAWFALVDGRNLKVNVTSTGAYGDLDVTSSRRTGRKVEAFTHKRSEPAEATNSITPTPPSAVRLDTSH